MELAHDRHHMPGTVQEIGIAERDVADPGTHLCRDVGEHHGRRHHEEAAAVDRRNRAVTAEVETAAARLDIAGGHHLAMPFEMRVVRSAREPGAKRRRKVEAGEMGRSRAAAHRDAGNRRQLGERGPGSRAGQ